MINLIVVHCAATPPNMDIGAAEIRKWHTDKGWSDIGYHYVIRRDGTQEEGREDTVQGAHVRGHNRNSLGICLVGGVDNDFKSEANFTFLQYDALKHLLNYLHLKYPDAEIKGHKDLDPGKDCPCFDVDAFWRAY